MKLIDMTDQRFGRLVVIKQGPKRPAKSGGSNWICLCDCGKEFMAIGSNIRQGHTTSCGCAAVDWAKKLGSNPDFIAKRLQSTIKHGHKRRSGMSVEYRTWLAMKARCYDPKNKSYPDWGGRGIRVCDRWNTSFKDFLEDMGPRPPDKQSIDRIRVNEDYGPGNCRWATLQEQASEHKRNLIVIEIGGVRYESLQAACAAFGMPYSTVVARLKRGLDPEVALKTPIRGLPNSRGKPVICIETGQIFRAGADAVKWLRNNGRPKASQRGISDCCNDKQEIAFGYHWRSATAY